MTADTSLNLVKYCYFNSHAHVERDEALEVWDDENEISTHTLTWSVTIFLCQNQHDIKYFNSHAHVERDLLYGKIEYTLGISTHTLTWSVT